MTLKKLLLSLVLLGCCSLSCAKPVNTMQAIFYNTPQSQQLIERSQYKKDLWPLLRYFVTQKNPIDF